MEIKFSLVQKEADLEQILVLQQQNLARHLSFDQIASQGFVTVEHTREQLQKMHRSAPSIIAKMGDQVVGYNIVMLPDFRQEIAVLVQMFDIFDSLMVNGQTLGSQCYIVCGQVCVAEAVRGCGVFEGMYAAYQQYYSPFYRYIVTEIADRNRRSLRAHEKVGFSTWHRYDTAVESWHIVGWEW